MEGIAEIETKAPKEVGAGIPSQIARNPHGARQSKQGASSGVRKISQDDIKLVQNLIERCLQKYMNRDEVAETLLKRSRIDAGFTTLVWQKLEEENPDFFREYYNRLELTKQITALNELLGQQRCLMQDLPQPMIPVPLVPNVVQQMPAYNSPAVYPVTHHQPMPTSVLPRVDSMNHNVSGSHVVEGRRAPGHFQHILGSMTNEVDSNGRRKYGELPGVPGMASPASVAFDGRFPFTPSDTSGMDVVASATHPAFPSDVGYGPISNSLTLDQITWEMDPHDFPQLDAALDDSGNLTFAPSDFGLFF